MRKWVLLAIFLLPFFCSGQEEVESSIIISVVTASQPDSPLQIVELRHQMKRAKGAEIVVQNVSRKRIVGFMLATALNAPPGCSPEPQKKGRQAGFRFEDISLSPGERASSKQNLLYPGIARIAVEDNTRYLQAQLGTAQVAFADGTVWEPAEENRIVFDRPLLQAESSECTQYSSMSPPDFKSVITKLPSDDWTKIPIVCGKILPTSPVTNLGYRLSCVVKGSILCCPVY